MISPRIGMGMAVSQFTRTTPGTLSAAVPHPFFFGAPRQVNGPITGLQREDTALHAQVMSVWGIGSHVEVTLSGGPSLFRVRQGIATDFTYPDQYPFDSASLQLAQVATAKNKMLLGIGVNAGGDAAFFFTRRVGVGVTAMFTRSHLDLPVSASRTVQVKAGGVTTAGGLRLRF